MTGKLQVKLAGIIAAVTGFVSWLATVPPEQQSGLLGPIVEVLPLSWRPTIGLVARGLASVSALWAVYKASHSGPTTPPPNPPV